MLYYKNRRATTQTRYAFYNSSKQFISGDIKNIAIDGELINTPSNAAYFITSNASQVEVMLAETDELIPFEPYGDAHILPQYIPNGEAKLAILNIPSKIYATEGIELKSQKTLHRQLFRLRRQM